jgi:uncharacterized membrane protein YfcA
VWWARLFVVTPDLHIAALLLLGSMPGVIVASHLKLRVPDSFVRLDLAGTLLFLGVRLI